MKTPVLFLIFNRPGYTRQVFDAIKRQQPARLYVAADGPRKGNAHDIENCRKAREIIKQVDWPCEVNTLFRDNHLSCKKAVTGGIDWFFAHEEMGIVLEDDCLPSPSFFVFCGELLEKYKHDNRVNHIAGYSEKDHPRKGEMDYFFSTYMQCWGWASWRRSWKFYDANLTSLKEFLEENQLRNVIHDRFFRHSVRRSMKRHCRPDNNWSWDWDYQYCLMKEHSLCINPSFNMITNLDVKSERMRCEAVGELKLPMKHPKFMLPDADFFEGFKVRREHLMAAYGVELFRKAFGIFSRKK
jgi:hypothetical protein